MQRSAFSNQNKGTTEPPPFDSFEMETAQERRKMFLRYVNRGWLTFGVVTLISLPLFPEQRSVFTFLIATTFPIYLITSLINRFGRIRLAGIIFTLSVNFSFYGLFIMLAHEMGAREAFNSQISVWMLMGLAVLFAGALIDKWAAPGLALVNSILLIGTRLTIAPDSDPRPSALVFWWMMALTIWLYERTLGQAFGRVLTELAERKQAEESLREAESKYRNLVERLPQVIYTSELGTNGVWAFVSPQIEKLLGYTPQEWLADPTLWYRQVHPQDRDKQNYLENEAYGRNQAFESEYRILTRSGNWIWVRDSGHILPAQSGGKPVVQGILMDVSERKRAEEEVSLSKAQLLATLNNTPNVAIQWYDKRGRILYWNPASEAMYGWKPADALGKTLDQLIHTPEEQAEFMRILSEVQQTGRPFGPYEAQIRRRDGTTGWVLATTFSIPIHDGQVGFVCMDADITERRHAEELLRVSEERYRLITENAEDIIWTANMELRLTYVSPSLERALGYTARELTQLLPEQLLTGESFAGGLKIFNEEVAAAQPQPDPNYARVLEMEYCRKDGSTFWAEMKFSFFRDSSGRPTGVLGVGRDVTVRKYSEEKLRASEERFRSIFEQSPIGMGLIDTISGKFLQVNPKYCEIVGRTNAKMLTMNFNMITHPDDLGIDNDNKQRLINGQIRSYNFEKRYIRPDQSVVWAHLTVVALWGKQEDPKIQLTMVADITERRHAEESLRESEAKYRSLFETANDSIFLIKENMIVDCNLKTLAMFACERQQIIGKSPADFSPSIQYDGRDSQEKALVKLDAVLDGEPQFFEWNHCRLDGSLFDAEVSLNRLELGDQYYVQAIVRDVTERKRAETELKRYAQNAAAMYQLSHQILTGLNLDQVYENTHQAVQKMMPCDAFVIALLDETMHEIEDVYLWDQDRRWPGQRHPAGQGLTSYVISLGKPLLVNSWDESHAEMTGSGLFGYTERNIQSVLSVPLFQTNGKCFGMISAQAYPPSAYIAEHEQLLVTLANQVSEAIENTRLFRDLQQSNSELSTAYDATIEGWSRAMDLRDKETEGHTQRVTTLTMKLAQQIGLRDNEIIQIRRGGLLHDIGKLGVPDSILFKDEDLTGAEWDIMHKHPTYAYEMLSSVTYLKPALAIPYCHHEKWDGTGYPQGLKGEQIPLPARIFAIVDVWDAIRSDRPYRLGWNTEKAIAYIKSESGTHFDPDVVKVFLKFIDEQKEILEDPTA